MLHEQFRQALQGGDEALGCLDTFEPCDRRDVALTLLAVHDLHSAPLQNLGGTERFQHHPAVASLKTRLEKRVLAELEADDAALGWQLPEDAVAAMRMIAAKDLVPEVYLWLADRASRTELVEFLALEGGPDAGFDDLVAACQIGLSGAPKLELAQNYWDEMGNGVGAGVHTVLHDQLVEAIGMPRIPREQLPVEVLERALLGSLLATNRYLQPEMLGALGLLELQAGPRCRKAVKALKRVGAPKAALPFYAEHATVDPRHGKDWLDKAIAPLAAELPEWAPRIVRGARWRSLVNARFFAAMAEHFAVHREQRQAS